VDGRAPERAAVAKPLASVGVEPPPLPRFEQWGPVERQPLSHLRRTIAERMTLSATLIPHVTHFDRADVTELDAIIRRNIEPARGRGITLTLTSFLLKAAALALQEHPQFNASLDPAAGELIVKRYHHLGVAVATERGLIVPVIRDVDRKPLVELQRELAALAQRVREGKATLDDLRGGTFTITNIGALGGRERFRSSTIPRWLFSVSPAGVKSPWCTRGGSCRECSCRSRSHSTIASPTAPTARASPPRSCVGSSALNSFCWSGSFCWTGIQREGGHDARPSRHLVERRRPMSPTWVAGAVSSHGSSCRWL